MQAINDGHGSLSNTFLFFIFEQNDIIYTLVYVYGSELSLTIVGYDVFLKC